MNGRGTRDDPIVIDGSESSPPHPPRPTFLDPTTIPGGFSTSHRSTQRFSERFQSALADVRGGALDGAPLWKAAFDQSVMNSLNPEHRGTAFQGGYQHEAVETLRLAESGTKALTGYQVPVPIYRWNRIPDLEVENPTRREFVDIKAGRNMSDSVAQLTELQLEGHKVNVAAGVSSANIDMGSLMAADRGLLRVRSNSMAEGQFIDPMQMDQRRQMRAQQFREKGEHPDQAPTPFPVI